MESRRHRVWISLAVAGLLPLISGCGGGGDDGGSGETQNEPLTLASAAGTWTGSNSFGENITATLRADGSFTLTVPAGTVTGTLTLSGSTVTGTYGDGFGTFTGVVTGNTMTGQFTEIDGDVATFTMTKP